MNPMKSDNIVAKVLQVYAYLNVLGGIYLATQIGGDIGWIYFAAVLVVSFLLFAFGEVIDLLQQIKANTNQAAKAPISTRPDTPQPVQRSTSLNFNSPNFYNHSSPKAGTPSGWSCSCGRVNPPYVTSCVCGKSKYDET